MEERKETPGEALDIAIIGMAGRFPGAARLELFWENLRDGVESIHRFSDEELLAAGVDAATLKRASYVKAAPLLDDIESFDADFFGFSPLDAKLMDPQRRVFMECCWHALENAGYDPERYAGAVGVYAGAGLNTYLLQNVLRDEALVRSAGLQQVMIGADKDFLPMQVSYKLRLTGPSVNVNSACSSSLVAVHFARQALLLGECDMALAGGVSLNVPQQAGYEYVPNGVQSPDGHCRAFDAEARGTLWGSGCGVVVLKRLSDALADGDAIRAVIKGSAINNDGAEKVGFSAPSVEGQAQVVVQALACADVDASSVSYVEAHGTGTELGDPIELEALTRAYRLHTDARGFCGIGSVKTNIGHLNAAAGVAGLIKTVLALEAEQLPPSLHFRRPNPKIDFDGSPFRVVAELTAWPRAARARRAGVSSLGIGGTNAHIVLEEAPVLAPPARGADDVQFLLLSARSEQALEAMTTHLAEHLRARPELALRDVAFTLQCGRKSFAQRRAIRCRSTAEAIRRLLERQFESGTPQLDHPQAELLARWLAGEQPDWSALYAGAPARRVPLPGYAFERTRLWIDPPAAREAASAGDAFWQKRPDMADWFYRPRWRQATLPLPAPQTASRRETLLVFADGSRLTGKLIERLSRAATVVTAELGERFARLGPAAFRLPAGDRAAYASLIADLLADGLVPDRVLHLWSLGAQACGVEAQRDLDALTAAQERGLFSLLYLTQALAAASVNQPMRLLAFSCGAHELTGGEGLAHEQSTLPGLCKVLQQEYNQFVCRAIDVVLPEPDSWVEDALVEALAQETYSETGEISCAYRGVQRWVQYYEPVRIEAAPARSWARRGAAYLVFYGLEGIGFLVARYLLQQGARLLILEEPGFPEPTAWGRWVERADPRDQTAIRIGNALGLQAMGFDFRVEVADFADREALRRTLARAEAQMGAFRGLIHASGASNFERIKPLRDLDVETCRRHFAAIPHSLMALDALLRDRDLDFRIMMSSLGSILGGLGFLPITSSSSIASTYLAMQNREHRQKWVVQYWDSWDIEWQKAEGLVHQAMYERLAPSVLTEAEGLECFARIFSLSCATQVAVSATALEARHKKWVELEAVRKAPAQGKPRKPPARVDAFLPPRNALERTIAEVYQQYLGVDTVSVNDGFHDLGGHSLLATQMITQLRQRLNVDLELFAVLEHPTVASLAAHLSGQLAGA